MRSMLELHLAHVMVAYASEEVPLLGADILSIMENWAYCAAIDSAPYGIVSLIRNHKRQSD